MKKKIYILKANCPAIHKLGDISREENSLFRVSKPDDETCEGQFVFGYGFFGVKVKADNLRPLTRQEYDEQFKGHFVQISDQPPIPFRKEDFEIGDR